MDDIYVSAPGKVILHGEHAVVYGKAAIASSLNLRSYLRLRCPSSGVIHLELPDVGIHRQWPIKDLVAEFKQFADNDCTSPSNLVDDSFVRQLKTFLGINPSSSVTTDLAVVAFLYLFISIFPFNKSILGVDILVISLLPISAGLGSSAAFSVCLTSSLLLKAGYISHPQSSEIANVSRWCQQDLELINAWAFLGEKIIHGTPSGIDNSVSCFGGAIHFKAGHITPISNMPEVRILLVNTKTPRSTKTLVANVRKRHDEYLDVIKPILESIESVTQLSQEIFAAISRGDVSGDPYSKLEVLIDINQCHLKALGVSHYMLDKVVSMAAAHGLHGKLTGAGGGGCAFVLLKPDVESSVVEKLCQELEKEGLESWETCVGSFGVVSHNNIDQLPNIFQGHGKLCTI